MYPVEKRGELSQKRALTSRPRFIIVVALLLASLWNTGHLSHALLGWKDGLFSPPVLVRANATLQWTQCPDNSTFYCSFFAVPLDYATPSSEAKTVIAMRMFPATVSASERLGSIFTNPGVRQLK